ncbi:MAG: hypothetical protein ACK4V1_02440 [Burkholderiaceae bacterium]
MRKVFVLASALLAIHAVSVEAASFDPVAEAAAKLLKAEEAKFTVSKPAEVKAMRQEFSSRIAAAKASAKLEYARMSAGKSAEQIDAELRARAKKAGAPELAVRAVEERGGPAKAMAQIDRIVDEFEKDVLSGSQRFARGPVDVLFDVLVPAAHAGRIRSFLCSVAVYTLTVGTGTDANYKLCMR